jgi:hypothetical protein
MSSSSKRHMTPVYDHDDASHHVDGLKAADVGGAIWCPSAVPLIHVLHALDWSCVCTYRLSCDPRSIFLDAPRALEDAN